MSNPSRRLKTALLLLSLTLTHTSLAHEMHVQSAGGKPASEATIAANQSFKQHLNFDDTAAFDNNNRGLIAALDQASGDLLRNSFSFIDIERAAEAPSTVNPSLWRQAVLNQAADGLYEVIPEKLYQIRGGDLASMSFIRGETGWIVYDVLTTRQAAATALEFFYNSTPVGEDLPVVAMLYSHSHADHFGGARGIKDAFPDVKVYGSKNITKETVDENVLAGNAMSRRAAYQYGMTLARREEGSVGSGLAKGISVGDITFVAPDYELNHEAELETLTIDGLEMIFLDASGTEAPSEMVTYIPSMKAIFSGELTFHGLHNVYTLRGAKVRDALKWSKKINQMMALWAEDAEVLFAAHSAPIWGNQAIIEFLKLQRDAYGFIHNQTLRLANSGVVMQDIGNQIDSVMPESIRRSWHTNGYHGTYSHNARAVYNMYLGFFDMNPANLNPLPLREESKQFVEYMGGASAVIKKAGKDFAKGNYRFAATALNKVVQADPDNAKARALLADSFEQLGYQAENAGWRNIYLTGAQELRLGKSAIGTPKTASNDLLAEIEPGMLLDFLAVRVDSIKAAKTPFTIALTIDEEIFLVEMSNGNLNNIKVENPPAGSDASLTLSRTQFLGLMSGQVELQKLVQSPNVSFSGDLSVFATLRDSLIEFDSDFEIMPHAAPLKDAALYEMPQS